MRGIRARLTATIVALVVLTASVLGIAAYAFVDARLHGQALDEAAAQARFDLTVLAPDLLSDEPTPAEIEALSRAFARRDLRTVVDDGSGEPYVSDLALVGLLDRLPADVRALVDAGQVAYAWTTVADGPALVVAGRVAGTGPAIFFVRSAVTLEATLEQLRIALGAGALLLALAAIVVARVIARGVLAPVEAAALAAERIAGGDLSARVPVASRDEFGAWAERFNAMADTLAATIRRLEAAQAQNRRFVSDVSHELRTPVAALVAEASILREDLGSLPPSARRAGELVVEDVGRLRTLVDDLMELSRFDAAGEEVRLEPVDLARLVRVVAAARHPAAALDLPDRPLVVDADPRRLERILGNLLDNAREHAPDAAVEVAVRPSAGAVEIVVADRGPGVPEDRIGRIFDRFYMADPSRRGGSGLGLAIAAEHAALLGGRIAAANRPGGGLEIAVELPVTESLPDGDPAATWAGEAGPR